MSKVKTACKDFRHKLQLSGPEDSVAELAYMAGYEEAVRQLREMPGLRTLDPRYPEGMARLMASYLEHVKTE